MVRQRPLQDASRARFHRLARTRRSQRQRVLEA
jgi:hypothetical protein